MAGQAPRRRCPLGFGSSRTVKFTVGALLDASPGSCSWPKIPRSAAPRDSVSEEIDDERRKNGCSSSAHRTTEARAASADLHPPLLQDVKHPQIPTTTQVHSMRRAWGCGRAPPSDRRLCIRRRRDGSDRELLTVSVRACMRSPDRFPTVHSFLIAEGARRFLDGKIQNTKPNSTSPKPVSLTTCSVLSRFA